MSANHTVKSYDQELAQIVNTVAEMGSLVERQTASALQAIHSRDNEIAGKAFTSDNEIDQLEHLLNERALQILALRQPMAGDLRLIVGAMKIARDLERIGDYAANLAKRARKLNKVAPLAPTAGLIQIGNLVAPIVTDVINAFTNNDTTLADLAYAKDEAVDEAYKKFLRELIQFMQSNPDTLDTTTHLLFMAKNIERIGDRATNIAETVHFIVKGTMPVSRRPKVLDS